MEGCLLDFAIAYCRDRLTFIFNAQDVREIRINLFLLTTAMSVTNSLSSERAVIREGNPECEHLSLHLFQKAGCEFYPSQY